jgi:hypothetical protein
MSVTRVGATKQYSDGWETIFGSGQRRTTATKAARSKSSKKSPKSKSAKKAARGKPKKAARKKKR